MAGSGGSLFLGVFQLPQTKLFLLPCLWAPSFRQIFPRSVPNLDSLRGLKLCYVLPFGLWSDGAVTPSSASNKVHGGAASHLGFPAFCILLSENSSSNLPNHFYFHHLKYKSEGGSLILSLSLGFSQARAFQIINTCPLAALATFNHLLTVSIPSSEFNWFGGAPRGNSFTFRLLARRSFGTTYLVVKFIHQAWWWQSFNAAPHHTSPTNNPGSFLQLSERRWLLHSLGDFISGFLIDRSNILTPTTS